MSLASLADMAGAGIGHLATKPMGPYLQAPLARTTARPVSSHRCLASLASSAAEQAEGTGLAAEAASPPPAPPAAEPTAVPAFAEVSSAGCRAGSSVRYCVP